MSDFDFDPLLLGLFGILCGAVIVVAFHYITMYGCRRRSTHLLSQPESTMPIQVFTPSSSTHFLSVDIYNKNCNEGICAVCLSEFVEGEEVRILPDCAHAFHVPCIDMWLYSHPHCPLCRAGISTHVVVSLPSSGELLPPVESWPDSGELSLSLESLPSSAGLSSQDIMRPQFFHERNTLQYRQQNWKGRCSKRPIKLSPQAQTIVNLQQSCIPRKNGHQPSVRTLVYLWCLGAYLWSFQKRKN